MQLQIAATGSGAAHRGEGHIINHEPISMTLSDEERRPIGLWAADCAERVLPLFEAQAPFDTRPREAIAESRYESQSVHQQNHILGNDVLQMEFSVEVAGEAVPCVIWKPSAPIESRTLIALGHGGSQHKQTRDIRDRAIRYATIFGWTSLAIDAPKHGDRITREEAEAERLKTERRIRGDLDAPSLRTGGPDIFAPCTSSSMHHLIAADPVALPILQRFSGVRVHDSTTIVLPDALAEQWRGCGGARAEHTSAALKCGVQLDLLTGALCGLDLADGRASDHRLGVQHANLPKRSLRLADLSFYDLGVLAALSAQEVYWLSKLEPTALITDESGRCSSLLAFVQALGAIDQWEGTVWVGKRGRVRARLLVQRVRQEVADQRRRRIRKTARDKGVTPSPAALALADWTLLLTNIPPELLTLTEALVIAKVRWQIELLFKLWKSQGQLDSWRSDKPEQILCEVYAKLLAMVVQHWALVIGCWQFPERSLVKAAQVVRDHAPELACARARLERLSEVLSTIQQVLRRTARMNPRKKHPNTYQLLLALTTSDEQA